MDPTIPEYFTDKHILVTGATGFMGKVLVEKLLRSCPTLSTIYVLVRSKRGKSAEERWSEILKLPLFDKLRETNPSVFKKTKVIEGNIIDERLGLSPSDRQLLIENVNLIYHGAASVQFTEDFMFSFRENTQGTYVLAELAKSMKKLKCFIYVSTSYSNCEKYPATVEEKVYPLPLDWRVLMEVGKQDTETFTTIKNKLMCNHPTTYTLTKALAETVMKDYSEYYPVVIIRPSIVLCAMEEPLVGWVDMLNGLSANVVAVGSGVLRTAYMNEEAYLDFVGVDHAIKGFIIATWDIGKKNLKNGLDVVSCNWGDDVKLTPQAIDKTCIEFINKYPFQDMFWYPFCLYIGNRQLFNLCFFLLHVIPSFLVDSILKLLGKPPRLTPITIKIAQAVLGPLAFFSSKKFTFVNTKFKELPNSLRVEDKNDFSYDISKLTAAEVVRVNCEGTYKHVLNLSMTDGVEKRLTKFKRLRILHYVTTILLGLVSCYLFCILFLTSTYKM